MATSADALRVLPEPIKAFDSACYAPYVAMEFDPQGRVFTCCANQLYPIGHVGESTLHEIWHGRRVQNLRVALRQYDLSSGCNVCKWHVEHGKEDAVARTYDDLPVLTDEPSWPQRMTFALSNRCNLACVMCSGELSSRIRHDEGLPPLPDAYGDAFFDELREFLPHLRYAAFLGGEPFLSPENKRVWQMLREMDHHIPLSITTNGTLFNRTVEETIDAFPCSFNLSIDAIDPDRLREIRIGVDPERTWANAKRLRDYTIERGTGYSFMYCFMQSNWRELPAMARRADEWGVKLQVIHVTVPGMNLEELSADELAHVVDELERAGDQVGSFGTMQETWDTELRQLRATLAERRSDQAVTIRRARHVDAVELLPQGGASPAEPPADHRAELERITRWAPDGAVVVFEADEQGTITEADLPPGPLTDLLGHAWLGRNVEDVIAVARARTGRDLWLIDLTTAPDARHQTLIFHDGPPRRGGGGGEIVRAVSLTRRAEGEAPVGTTTYLALDPFYAEGD
mgnify:CR=1 FL=1